MWSLLTMVVLAASPASDPARVELTSGTRVRLGAGALVDVPDLFTGTVGSHVFRRKVEKREGLYVFAAEDGGSEAVIAPERTVEGTLVGADPTYLHFRRGDRGPAVRIRRASVSRVRVRAPVDGVSKGAKAGGIAGAALGLGTGLVLTQETSDTGATIQGMALMTVAGGITGMAVGAVVGAVSPDEEWREVPVEALPGREDQASRERDAKWEVVVLGEGPGITIGVVELGGTRGGAGSGGAAE